MNKQRVTGTKPGDIIATMTESTATDDLFRSLRTGGRLLLYTNDETIFHDGDFRNADLIVVLGTLNEMLPTYNAPTIYVDSMNSFESLRATRAHHETYRLGLDPNNWARVVMRSMTPITSDRHSLGRYRDIDAPTKILKDEDGMSEHEAASSHEVAVDSESENAAETTPDGTGSSSQPMKSAKRCRSISTDTSKRDCIADDKLSTIANDASELDEAASRLEHKRRRVTEISTLKRLGCKSRAKARANTPLIQHDTETIKQLSPGPQTPVTERYIPPVEPLRAETSSEIERDMRQLSSPLVFHLINGDMVIDLTE